MKNLRLFLLGLLTLAMFVGCVPYNVPKFVDIAPNETAFVVPLVEGTKNDQAMFMSEQYLNEKKVAAKRVQIRREKVKTGYFKYEYKDLDAVIKVDRTPVSREWISKTGDATTKAPGLESVESIGIYIGTTITAMIEEGDAAKFLYKYAGRPLIQVIDDEIKSFIKGQYSQQFAAMKLDDIKKNKLDGVKKASEATKAHFKESGITITQLSFTEGILFDDENIQNAMNSIAVEQAKKDAADAFKKRQEVELKNQNDAASAELKIFRDKANAEIEIDKARAKAKAEQERYAAEQAKANIETTMKLSELEIEKIRAQAALEFARNPNLKLPNVVPSNTFTSMGLDKLFPTSTEDKQ